MTTIGDLGRAYLLGPTAAPAYQPSKTDGVIVFDEIERRISQSMALAETSIQWKQAVSVVATSNIAVSSGLAAGAVIDGVTLTAGMRVLLAGQTAVAENGIYDVPASGAASRSADCNTAGEIVGSAVYVTNGSTRSGRQYALTTLGPVTLGTTALVYEMISQNSVYNSVISDLAAWMDGAKAKVVACNYTVVWDAHTRVLKVPKLEGVNGSSGWTLYVPGGASHRRLSVPDTSVGVVYVDLSDIATNGASSATALKYDSVHAYEKVHGVSTIAIVGVVYGQTFFPAAGVVVAPIVPNQCGVSADDNDAAELVYPNTVSAALTKPGSTGLGFSRGWTGTNSAGFYYGARFREPITHGVVIFRFCLESNNADAFGTPRILLVSDAVTSGNVSVTPVLERVIDSYTRVYTGSYRLTSPGEGTPRYIGLFCGSTSNDQSVRAFGLQFAVIGDEAAGALSELDRPRLDNLIGTRLRAAESDGLLDVVVTGTSGMTITGTTPVPVVSGSQSALLRLVMPFTNTGTVTLSVNGESLPLADALGNAHGGGSLMAGQNLLLIRSSGSWRVVNEAVRQILRATITSSTGSTIQFTTNYPVQTIGWASLIAFEMPFTNSGPVYARANGGSVVPIKDPSGGDFPAGALVTGRTYFMIWTGSEFRVASESQLGVLIGQVATALADMSAQRNDTVDALAALDVVLAGRDRLLRETSTIVILGQSNTVGAALTGGDRSPIAGVRMWYDGAVIEGAQPGVNPSANYNFVYGLIRRLRALGRLPASGTVNVVVAAEGGNGLTYWDTTTKAGKAAFRTQIETGLAALGATQVDAVFSIWGEEDSTTFDTGYNDAPRFTARILSILAEMKAKTWWTKSTAWVLGMLGQWPEAPYLRNDAIMSLAGAGIDGLLVVDSAGLTMATEDGAADYAHFDGASLDVMGSRFAEAISAHWSGARPVPLMDAGRRPHAPPYDLGTLVSGTTVSVGRDKLRNGLVVRMRGASSMALPNASDVPGAPLTIYVDSLTGGSPIITCLQAFQQVPWAADTTTLTFGQTGVYTFSAVGSRWNFCGSSRAETTLDWDASYTIDATTASVTLTVDQCAARFWSVSGSYPVILPNPNSVSGHRQVALLFTAAGQLDCASGGITVPMGAGVAFAGSPIKIPAGSLVVLRPGGSSRWIMTTSPYAVAAMTNVVVATSAYTISDQDAEVTITNDGAAGSVPIALPTARAGKRVKLIVMAAQSLTATALSSSSNRIRHGATLGAVGGAISSATIGNTVTLLAVNTSTWVVESYAGTWTVT